MRYYSNNMNQIINSNLFNQQFSPKQQQVIAVINYTLIATALTTIFIYHYLKQQDNHGIWN